MKVLIPGGAGFVGSNLARLIKEAHPKAEIVAFDNLKRRGSELNIPILKKYGIEFRHGDIRSKSDFDSLGKFDVMIEASAEPSVLAGTGGESPLYAIETNLGGTINALEFARANCGGVVFLSTSRVYSIPALTSIKLREGKTRFEADIKGVDELFSTNGFRSIYGATKLASELLIQEYAQAYGMKAVINRCGVIAGAGQFGKTDQGVFTLWVAKHHFGGALKYTGFGGKGLQVRDLLHPRDLFSLVETQIGEMSSWKGEVFNVGGGMDVSTSLLELTGICQEVTGKKIEIGSQKDSASVDIPWYVTDASVVQKKFAWKPEVNVRGIVKDIAGWLNENEAALKPLFT